MLHTFLRTVQAGEGKQKQNTITLNESKIIPRRERERESRGKTIIIMFDYNAHMAKSDPVSLVFSQEREAAFNFLRIMEIPHWNPLLPDEHQFYPSLINANVKGRAGVPPPPNLYTTHYIKLTVSFI
jgi:hypothetical protein